MTVILYRLRVGKVLLGPMTFSELAQRQLDALNDLYERAQDRLFGVRSGGL